jgi:Zn-finger nucleic acid-binding protein
MNAETLNCPMCGAATSTDEPLCKYCGARLATIACASCFGMMFLGSKHCQRCGAAAAKRESGSFAALSCPRCRTEMQALTIGSTTVRECERCSGLWVDVTSFEKICADREQQAAVLGAASPAPRGEVNEGGKIRYAPCPHCGQLMNRINFARCSGVIVDICKGHGSWFDRDELTGIVEFIRAGGLDAARAREKAAIEEDRRQLRQERLSVGGSGSSLLDIDDDDHRNVGITSGIASARGLLKLLLD